MKKPTLGLVSLLYLMGTTSYADTFSKVREYRYLFFETEEACQDYQSRTGSWFNCFQSIEFYPNGKATVMVTDILQRADYTIDFDAGKVLVKKDTAGDMPEEMIFQISPNKRAIVESGNYKVWEWVE